MDIIFAGDALIELKYFFPFGFCLFIFGLDFIRRIRSEANLAYNVLGGIVF
jgi:hypothetical protein